MPSASRASTTCGGFDGLVPGATIPFTILSAKAGSADCVTHEASVDIASWDIQGMGLSLATANDVEVDMALFRRSVSIAGCWGAMEIDFRTSGALAGPVAPDRLPPFLVDRYFRTMDVTGCPALGGTSGEFACSDTWVAVLQDTSL